ncbi:SURF1 family protein [Nocardioides sp. Soil777]|uniref:SURF1 family cytochrome oxidase biogenesis protein n=1 Tax=Nocardioides sp. Soil777 TaxID=1736409 RepID=UPI0009E7A821|nr:SURF1 family protein [Nocardioides sp. Soil777]
MRRFRFLLSRRWVLFLLTVLALAWVAWRLGEWQFHRLEDRKDRNAIIERNETQAPVPVTDVLGIDAPVSSDEEWTRVTATGTYDVDSTVVVRYRTRDGAAGVDVVVPLVLADGTSLLVDRGWFATDNRGTTPDDVPAPPAGEVEIEGWVRADAAGDSAAVTDFSTRAISSAEIGPAIDREVLEGFVDLRSESPEPEQALAPAQLPDLDNGPHFFYGLQWWFFGALALFGFAYLVYDESRGGRGPVRGSRRQPAAGANAETGGQSERSMPPSTGSMTPVTKDAAGDSRKAAARPNSSGSP